ncbi:endogenous retrovirus group K member 19 Env polyprotein [Pan paniscus]|uniref:endogenous retrovirus group K member 19 Env polyprotein n=1 Tax=Pan paniscus TaxID=9597 RepID=UPI0015608684|nr:endogenous retrovirus group K member 19 Env polyprotein [Pan paniscus]
MPESGKWRMTDKGRPSTFSLQALQERISFLSGYPQDILSCAMRQSPRKRKRPQNVSAPPVCQTAQMNISVEQMETSKTPQATPPTWGQMKRLAHIAEENLRSQNKPLTTSNLMVAMMAVISLVVSLPVAEADRNYTYSAYIPFPPPIRPVTWLDAPVEVYVHDSVWMPGPTDN